MSTRVQTRSQSNPGLDSFKAGSSDVVQRKCACGGLGRMAGTCEQCNQTKKVQRKSLNHRQPAEAGPASFEGNTNSHPLSETDPKTFFATRFSHDFSRVRIQNSFPPIIQPKLTVGEPDNQFEREADLVADRMLRPDHEFGAPHEHALERLATVQRQETSSSAEPEVASDLETSIDQLKGSGHPLPASARSYFEPRFGHDFSQVRLHTGARAADSARRLGAQAYTVGKDIAFGSGFYAPETLTGRRLLAHELTHVLQQRPGASLKIRLQRLSDFNDTDAAHDPSKLTDAEIESTHEYKSYMNPKLIWQTVEKMTREEALLASRLMLRHMREGKSVTWSSDGRVFMNLARSQGGALKSSEAAVGTLEWVPFSTTTATTDPSKLASEFGKWILAGGPEPDKTAGKVNCWEMVMFSAFKGGFTTKARITSIYNEAVKQVKAGSRSFVGDTIEVELRRGKEYVLDPADAKSIEPLPGDIIIFSTAKDHVAISLGTKDASGRHEIISHWPPPDGSHKAKKTTIEELLPSMSGGTVVKFWSPKW